MKLRIGVVWLCVSPFVFLTVALWSLIWFVMPAQRAIQREINRSSVMDAKVFRENQRLRIDCVQLQRANQALAVENETLNRSFDKISRLSLQAEVAQTPTF